MMSVQGYHINLAIDPSGHTKGLHKYTYRLTASTNAKPIRVVLSCSADNGCMWSNTIAKGVVKYLQHANQISSTESVLALLCDWVWHAYIQDMSVMKQGDADNLYERAVPGYTACTPCWRLNGLFTIQSAVADLNPPSDGKAQPSYKGFKLQSGRVHTVCT